MIFPHLNYCLLAWGTKCDKITKQQKRVVRTIHLKSRTAHTEPILKGMYQLKLTDLYICRLLKFYYKLYRNGLPDYFESFLPEYGSSRYPLRYDGLHMPQATREFCSLNAKYQLHHLLREISHPTRNTDRPYPSREHDPTIETLILSMSPLAFGKHIKITFIESYSIVCNIPGCINKCALQHNHL